MTLNKERQAQWSLSMSRNRKQRPTSRGESSFGKLLAVLIGLSVILAIGSIFYINMSKVKIEIVSKRVKFSILIGAKSSTK